MPNSQTKSTKRITKKLMTMIDEFELAVNLSQQLTDRQLLKILARYESVVKKIIQNTGKT